MGRFQLLNLGALGYGLELRFWVVIAIIVSLTLIEREPRTVIHVKRAKMFDPMG